MLNMPILKFEKSCTYLKEQLEIQENIKQLLLDIIGNVGSISNDSSDEEKENYDAILDSANELLQTTSSNIRTLEHLNLEISSITRELTDLLSDKNRNSKSKEFYIAAFSNLKTSITQYTEKFKNIETKLVIDENDFNTFIKENNLKYNFDSIEINDADGDVKTNYQFTGFSIANDHDSIEEIETIDEVTEDIETTELSIDSDEKSQKIEALTNEFKDMLSGLSNDSLSNVDLNSFLTSYVTKLSINNIDVKDTVTGARKDDLNEIIGFVKDSVQEELNQAIDEVIEEPTVNDEILEEITAEIELEEVPTATTTETKETVSPVIVEIPAVTNNTPKYSMEDDIFNEYETFDTSTYTKFKPLPKTNTVKTEEIFSSVSTTTTAKDTSEYQAPVSYASSTEEVQNTAIESYDIGIDVDMDVDNIDSEDTLIENISVEDNLLDDILLESIIQEDLEESIIKNVVDVDPIQKEEIKKAPITIEEKIEKIKTAESDNETLVISERTNSIYLPYKISELLRYVETYPNVYASLAEVVEQEFILPFDYFMNHPFKSRFFETYNLIRNRQGKPVTHAVRAGLKLIYKHNLNPAIIAACKTEHELNSYLYYLDNKNLKGFKFFNIHYDINPL